MSRACWRHGVSDPLVLGISPPVVLHGTNECLILRSLFVLMGGLPFTLPGQLSLRWAPFIASVSSVRVQRTTLAGCLSTWALGSLRPPIRDVTWTSLVLRVLGELAESLLDAGSLPALRLQSGVQPCSPFVPARRVVLLRDHPDLASSTVRLRAPSANWIP